MPLVQAYPWLLFCSTSYTLRWRAITLCDMSKYITIVGSGSNCVHFYGNRTNKCFRHMIIFLSQTSNGVCVCYTNNCTENGVSTRLEILAVAGISIRAIFYLTIKVSYRKGTYFCMRFIYANYVSQAQVA